MNRVFLCILGYLVMSITWAGAAHAVTKYPGWTYMGSYEPKSPKSLTDIPPQIREKVTSHLKARLGENFYKSLRFAGGQVIDFDQLYRKEPEAKHYKWEVHAYDLHFEFRKPELGITSYTAQIKLRSDGSVLEEINLPRFSKSAEKLHFISLKDAELIAKKSGLTTKSIKAEIDYDKKKDILEWRFTEIIADDGLRIKFKNIEVSAHDGSIARKYNSEAIR